MTTSNGRKRTSFSPKITNKITRKEREGKLVKPRISLDSMVPLKSNQPLSSSSSDVDLNKLLKSVKSNLPNNLKKNTSKKWSNREKHSKIHSETLLKLLWPTTTPK